MRPRLLLLLLSAYAFFAVKAPSQQAPNPSQSGGTGYGVAGIVLQRGSNQPLKHVQVSLTSVEHRNRQLFYITPANGQFVFSGLAPGKYSLEAQLHGFAQAFRGMRITQPQSPLGRPSIPSTSGSFWMSRQLFLAL